MGLITQSWRDRLEEPIAPYSLAIFRIMFGLLMCWEVCRYFYADWIQRYYMAPEFLFKYLGFEWVQPWPGDGLYWHFGLLGITAVLITLGLFYRLAMWLFLFGFSYIFLLDQARYLNHFYLVCIVAFMLCLVPAHHALSLDATRYGKARAIPQWALWSLLLLFEILLLYAGIVKINADWLAGMPLNLWFTSRAEIPLIGPFIAGQWAIQVAAYGAIALHLVGAPLLLFRRTRPYVFICYAIFHISNAIVFNIGIFPWLTLAGTLLFFSADWPLLLARRIGFQSTPTIPSLPLARTSGWLYLTVGLFLLLQAAIPLRHYLYPGNVAWTEEGHRFAWRMKLRSKHGHAKFYISDPKTGQEWKINPRDYLSGRQTRYLVGRPDMILQFAKYLEQRWQQEFNLGDLEVRASVWCSLNGHPHRLLIDPEIDLTQAERRLWPSANWVLPHF